MSLTLLDADILSDYLRGRDVHVLQRAEGYIRTHGRLTISSMTVFEVVRGRHQAQQAERSAQFLAWTRGAEVLPFDAECARIAGELAGTLLRAGTPVGVADILIAATAIANKATLATANLAHFQRMMAFGLGVENWREKS